MKFLLKLFGWLVIPYIMILFQWKKLKKPGRVIGSTWAAFALLMIIFGNSEEEISNQTAVSTSLAHQGEVVVAEVTPSSNPQNTGVEYDYELIFPSDKYPETALHIQGAIDQGFSNICTIDREGSEANRKESLAGIDTKNGYDRDEWPMAMCAEGGKGASVAYIDPSDNRGAGSWVGNQLEDYPNGTKILFIVEKPTNLFPVENATASPTEKPVVTIAPTPEPTVKPTEKPTMKPTAEPTAKPTTKPTVEPTQAPAKEYVYYKNCTAARAAGAAPVYKGDPGYAKHLDRDGDGVGCE